MKLYIDIIYFSKIIFNFATLILIDKQGKNTK